jgi:hypothetical protein
MKKFHFIFILIIGLGLTSCTEVIDVDVPENTVKFVIEGSVNTEQDSSFVRITKSVGYFDNTTSTPYVTNATTKVNGVTFTHIGNGMYKPASPYKGIVGTVYNLSVNVDGKTFTSSSYLEPMFEVDTVITYFKKGSGFVEDGYAVKYIGIDNRTPVKYTYFRFGFNSLIDSEGRDSIDENRILFDNKSAILNQPYEFELPFVRLQPNDTAILIFRSIDETAYRYYFSLTNRTGGGPFSTPPSNLPTNIKGTEEALGLFAAYDVVRFRTRVVQ